jgi:hypothetical protein
LIEDLVLSKSGSGGYPKTATLALENSGQYSSIAWRVIETNVIGNGYSFTLDSASFSIGEYRLILEVVQGERPYSNTVYFTVAP